MLWIVKDFNARWEMLNSLRRCSSASRARCLLSRNYLPEFGWKNGFPPNLPWKRRQLYQKSWHWFAQRQVGFCEGIDAEFAWKANVNHFLWRLFMAARWSYAIYFNFWWVLHAITIWHLVSRILTCFTSLRFAAEPFVVALKWGFCDQSRGLETRFLCVLGRSLPSRGLITGFQIFIWMKTVEKGGICELNEE